MWIILFLNITYFNKINKMKVTLAVEEVFRGFFSLVFLRFIERVEIYDLFKT